MPLASSRKSSDMVLRQRKSLPSTIESTTKVSLSKANRRRSSIRGKRQSLSKKEEKKKENEKENNPIRNAARSPGPTPYWQVVAERGGPISPPLTRSATKKKEGRPPIGARSPPAAVEERPTGIVLNFSPPDQVANRRREQEQIINRERERSKRVAMAKENGQYLEFSTRGSPLFPLRGAKDISSTDVMQQMTTEGVKDSPMARESKERPHKHDATLEIAAQKETLQSLQEGMNKLLESKSFDGEAATQLEEVKVENAALLEQNKQLTHLSTKLEGTIRELETAKEELTSTLSRAKEQHLVETTRLNGEAEAVKREFEIRLVSVQESKGALENQLLATEGEKDAMAKRVLELEKELVIAHNNDRENNAKMQENGQLHEEIVKKLEAEVAKAMNELQEREDQHEQEKASLAAEIKRYKEDVDLLENQLLPEAEAQRQESDRQLTEMRKLQNELTSKVTASKEKVVQLDREKRNLKEQLDTLNQDSQEMFSEQQSQISELHTKLEHQEKLLCVEQDKTKEAQQLRESMEKELEGLAEDLESKQQHIDEWTGKFEVSERERATLLATLKLEREANASLCEQKNDAMQKGSDAAQAIQNLRDSLYKETARSEQLQLKLTTAEQERDNTIKNLNEFDQREAELYRKLREGEKVRRELHNRVMQLSGNIRVYVRVRPPLPGEVERQMAAKATKSVGRKRKHAETEVDPMPFKFPGLYDRERGGASGSSADDLSKNLIEVVEPRKDRGGLKERRKKWRYGFDHIFTPTQNQDDVWEATEPLVQSAVDGFNVCIFAYGQTGSGKSYTMLGENSNQGIVSRAVSKLFAAKEQLETLSQGATKVEIAVELLEIYNEEIRDLLAPTKGQQKLKVANNDVVGNVLATAASKDNVMAILDLAQGRRCVKATKSNDSSSRSHMVFTVHFDVKSGDGIQRKGKLHVCDLAGSERLSKSGANASEDLLKETKHINSSLSVLSNVIEKLQSGNPNVPYRESKLTMLLQNSLGGNSKTLAIVCCNPLASHFHESLCSLRFADRVNKVDLKAVANFQC